MRIQGIRNNLERGQKRHEFKALHGFRKFFKTRAEQIMKPINVEILMGHGTGISDSNYKPTEKELLDDYLKSTNFLTLNHENVALAKQIKKLEEGNKNSEYIIQGRLKERDEQVEILKDQFSSMKKIIDQLVNGLSQSKDQTQVNSFVKSLFDSGLFQAQP